MKKLIFILLSIFVCNLYAINPFVLKGKHVIFSPDESNEPYPNVYNEKTIKGTGFKERNLLYINPYGKEVFVEDVQISKKPKDFPFLYFVCRLDNHRFTIAYRLDSKNDIQNRAPHVILSTPEVGKLVELDVEKPTDVDIEVYTKDYLDSIANVLKTSKKYALKQFGDWYVKGKKYFTYSSDNTSYGKQFVSSLGKPLTFLKFDYGYNELNISSKPRFNHVWYNNTVIRPRNHTLCAVFTDSIHEFYIYLNAALDENVLIDEDAYMKMCTDRFADYGIEQILQMYKGKELHYVSDKYGLLKGSWIQYKDAITLGFTYQEKHSFVLQDIVLKPQLERDSVFMAMYYEFTDTTCNALKKDAKLYIPVSKDWQHKWELASDYKKRIEQEEFAIQQEHKRREEMLAREEAEYKASLVKKYGKTNAETILSGKVKIGFTKQMCEEAWGSPIDINRTVTIYGTTEQWVYGLSCYLYFEGNKLTGIQN